MPFLPSPSADSRLLFLVLLFVEQDIPQNWHSKPRILFAGMFLVFFPVFRIRILRKNKTNNTITLEKMEGQQIGSSCLNVMAFKTLLLNRTKALLCLLITPSVLGKLWEVLSSKWHKLTQNVYEIQQEEVICMFLFSFSWVLLIMLS